MNAARGETKRSDSRPRVEPNGNPDHLDGRVCHRAQREGQTLENSPPLAATKVPQAPTGEPGATSVQWHLRRRSRPSTTGGPRDKACDSRGPLEHLSAL